MNSNINILKKLYEREGTYLKATVCFIDEILDLDISEFKIEDLPNDWIKLIEIEVKQKKMLKEYGSKKCSFRDILNETYNS